MKTKLFFFALLISLSSYAQFQLNYDANVQNHYHDLNIEPAKDGSLDVIMAGNLFDASMSGFTPLIQRLNNGGTTIWTLTFDGSPLQHARIFDIETIYDMVIMTGSVDVGGTKRAFAAKVELATGNLLDTVYYEIVSPNFNATALHISYTENDINGDSIQNPGFMIGGFFSNSYSLNTNAMNIGFVIRTDFDLEPYWTIEIDSNAGGNADYDMVNNITETNDGYFITGGTNDNTTSQQAVLAHKIDVQGTFAWDASYILGNSQDVSVDAYYDTATNQIFMLSNYSVTHQFGVTTIDNTSGVINTAQSWYYTNNELNHYGFTIMESISDPDYLMIVGYDRDENWTDGSGNSHTSQSNVFVLEFEKSTGNQVGDSYQYLVTHQEPTGDEYNFWNGQMPLIYYPDIATIIDIPGAFASYFEVGYKTQSLSPFTQASLFNTLDDKRNICDRTDLFFTPNPLNKTDVTSFSGSTPNQAFLFSLTTTSISPILWDCENVLSVEDQGSLEGSYLYPNPTQDLVYTTAINASEYVIYDFLGRKVSSGLINQNKSINLNKLKNGLYFITIIDINNISETFKVIKK